jgi:hypothetical protein
LRPIETHYRGCRFRSRIEARWAVFFDALGIKWSYEPEGFSLRFDYEDLASSWMEALDITEDELLDEGFPQTFKHLDGKEYSYLPDFYLPELHSWVEIKGPTPTREEVEKAFILGYMASKAGRKKSTEAKTEAEVHRLRRVSLEQGVYIIYGEIPWPFPQKGNILGYGGTYYSGSNFLDRIARAEPVVGESRGQETEYRSLLMGQLELCWQECPLCLRVGVGKLGAPYCRSCHDHVAQHVLAHLAGYRVMGGAEPRYWRKNLNPANLKAMKLAKDLINPEFFTSGHKTPKLHEAYNAARSARFEHGQSP